MGEKWVVGVFGGVMEDDSGMMRSRLMVWPDCGDVGNWGELWDMDTGRSMTISCGSCRHCGYSGQ